MIRDVHKMLTIPDNSRSSLTKKPIIAKLINKDDSPIAECEINLKFLSISVAIIPHNEPTPIDSKLSAIKSPNIYRYNVASVNSAFSSSFRSFIRISFIV